MTVIIYSTQHCPWCSTAKNFLKSNGISFEERDVEINPLFAREMISKSGQMGVPVLDINGKIIVGFDANAIKKALNI